MRSRLAALLAACALLAGCQPAAESPAGDVTLESAQQRGSYAQGVNIGRQGQGLPLDVEAFILGIRDGLAGGEGQLTEQEMQQAMMEFSAFMNEEAAAAGSENRLAGEAFLADNANREGVVVTASGLQYEVLEQGDGEMPTAAHRVRVHYRGTTIDGEVFDESYSRGEPAEFAVGGVIAGWTEALQLMPVGSKYKLFIPADLAYGDNARPGAPFGPGSTLIFEVELLEIR